MEKFSTVKEDNIKKEEKILFEDEYTKLVSYDDWTILQESDTVVCIPFLIEYNQFIIRQEYIPSFKIVDGNEFYITVIAGSIEDKENPTEALRRELEEEAGIVIRDNFNIEFEAPLFKSKSGSSKFHFCIMPLTESDYHEVIAKGDGSKAERISKSVKVSVKNINNILPSDTITALMLDKLKKYLNM